MDAYPNVQEKAYESDLYASKAYSPDRPPGEIYSLVLALKSAVDDVDKSFAVHRERLSPIRAPRPTAVSDDSPEKRGCATELGGELGIVLDRLQALRYRIEATSMELEL